MASPNRPARLNRTLLLLVRDRPARRPAAFALLTAPGVLALVPADQALTPQASSPPNWAASVTVVVAVVVGLLALRWLLAQTQRRARTGTWRLEDDPARDHPSRRPGRRRPAGRRGRDLPRGAPSLRPARRDRDAADTLPRRRHRGPADITELRRRIDTEALPGCAGPRPRHPARRAALRLDDARSARLS